ncbi:MAG: type II secretion system protein GspN [Bdellovibrionales bacterium GWB1_55_8]|nr:MAG: type II secretion system protein GspN [Bdellovibrionales bacterium GWB1_55_8]
MSPDDEIQPIEDYPDSSTQTLETRRPPTRFERVLKRVGWISLAFFFLIFFTLLKLPEDRLKNTIQGYLTSMLADQGFSFTAEKSRLSIGLGVSYELEKVTLRPPAPATPIRLERLGVSPSLLPMLFGRRGGRFWMEAGSGKITGSISMRGSQVSASFDSKDMDLKQLGIPGAFTPVAAEGILSGSGEISGDFGTPASISGKANIVLKKIVIAQQNIMGFAIPKIGISDAIADVVIEKGKLRIQEFRFGREGASPPDDIRVTFTGQITLAPDPLGSTLDLKTRFSFSPAVLRSFALVEAMLAAGKQPDGSYSFLLKGPAYSPTPTPVAP